MEYRHAEPEKGRKRIRENKRTIPTAVLVFLRPKRAFPPQNPRRRFLFYPRRCHPDMSARPVAVHRRVAESMIELAELAILDVKALIWLQ
jgi:hypothetical protein